MVIFVHYRPLSPGRYSLELKVSPPDMIPLCSYKFLSLQVVIKTYELRNFSENNTSKTAGALYVSPHSEAIPQLTVAHRKLIECWR
jgi:hypothetical protein